MYVGLETQADLFAVARGTLLAFLRRPQGERLVHNPDLLAEAYKYRSIPEMSVALENFLGHVGRRVVLLALCSLLREKRKDVLVVELVVRSLV